MDIESSKWSNHSKGFSFFFFLELSNTKVILSKIITHMFINVKPDLHFVQYMFER